ncbi:hypothetical protein M3J09_006101 [Ascochyta lentis]
MASKSSKNFLSVLKHPGTLLKTLYLFGKSDIPVATLPTIAIALVLSGRPSVPAFVGGYFGVNCTYSPFRSRIKLTVLKKTVSRNHIDPFPPV